MAIINCPECNREISSNAVACPHCGNPLPKKLVNVHFHRKKVFNTSQFHASVFVDGVLVGSIENGSQFDKGFSVGIHTVSLRNERNGVAGGNSTDTKQFEIKESTRSVNIEFAFKTGFVTSYIYIKEIRID